MSGYPKQTWRPPHAYVPGVTPRHPEHLFFEILTGVSEWDYRNLHLSSVWPFVKAFMREGYFWEAHELLEALWRRCPPNSAQSLLLMSLIQHANAGLKVEMGRPKAEARLRVEALRLWREAFLSHSDSILGFQYEDFGQQP